MVVMTDEAFEQHGIKRRNKERVERELKAQKKRKSMPIQSHRADTSKPMFKGPAHIVGSGTGSFSVIGLGLLGCLAICFKRRSEK